MSEGVSYEDYLRDHGSLTYASVGTSMLPLLREGRDLFTVEAARGRCRVGDVVLYRRPPSHWVLHRVVRVLPDGYVTLGDNSVRRERVAEADVVGVMVGFVRDGRAHGVGEPVYRAYTLLVLATNGPRTLARRVAGALRRRRAAHA